MFQIKELLTVLAADWERFKGTKEIEVLNEYALNGRKLTLSYAGKQLFPGLLLNFHITCWKIFIWNRFNFSIVRLMFCLGCMYGAMTPFMIIPSRSNCDECHGPSEWYDRETIDVSRRLSPGCRKILLPTVDTFLLWNLGVHNSGHCNWHDVDDLRASRMRIFRTFRVRTWQNESNKN